MMADNKLVYPEAIYPAHPHKETTTIHHGRGMVPDPDGAFYRVNDWDYWGNPYRQWRRNWICAICRISESAPVYTVPVQGPPKFHQPRRPSHTNCQTCAFCGKRIYLQCDCPTAKALRAWIDYEAKATYLRNAPRCPSCNDPLSYHDGICDHMFVLDCGTHDSYHYCTNPECDIDRVTDAVIREANWCKDMLREFGEH
jgi:hypothetical protein